MSANEIVQLIANVGFPIVMCLLMFKNSTKTSEVIAENTKAINLLAEKVDRLEHDVNDGK